MPLSVCPAYRRRYRRDEGLTLIEMVVTLALAGSVMAIATGGMRAYLNSTRELGTAQDVRSTLRNTAERAVSEGRTYCVYFTTSTWTVYRSDCTVAANKADGPNRVQDPAISLSSVTFTAGAPTPNQNTACPAAGRCAYFYPRGTALAGAVQITRPGKTYTVNVEGLTSRVSLS